MAFEKNKGDNSNSKHVNLNEGSKFVPKTISELNSCLRSYENELKKVDAFKRELPLCMQFLKNGIEKLKEEKLQCKKKDREMKPIITLPNTEEDEYQQQQGYFSPSMCDDDEAKPVDDEGTISGGLFGRPPQKKNKKNKKKRRLCWSPELHRVFVHALDEIGGAEDATPKKILEKMKVEGLTNDEVKSHLQKYRIHIRKLASASLANSSWLTNNGVFENDGNNNMQANEVVGSKSWGKQVDHRF